MWDAKSGLFRSTAAEKHRKRERESSPEEERGQKRGPSSVEEIRERADTDADAGEKGSGGAVASPSGRDSKDREPAQRSVSPTQPPPPSASTPTVESRARTPPGPATGPVPAPVPVAPPVIDVRWEASKLPLDVAIFNSTRAAGGVDRIKKFLQVVVVVGGTSIIPGMVHALESRLQAIAFPLVPGMEKVQVVPSPKDIDPRVLSWKGAAVLAKLESLNDMWITATDWDMLGMRALRERTLFM